MVSRRAVLTGAGAAVAAGAVYGGVRLSGSGGDVVPGQSRARAIQTETTPPQETEVAVIGGGIVGAATAYYLAKAGVPVTLFEKGAVGGEASGRAQGVVSASGLDKVKLPLIAHSRALYAGLNADLGLESGFRPCGAISGIMEDSDAAFWEQWLREAGPLAPEGARLLSGPETDRLLPANWAWKGGFIDPGTGGVEPTLIAPAFAEAAAKLGAHIVAPCAVRGFETEAGRVAHVVTEKGPVKVKAVVLAGGAWSSMFARHNDIKLPILNIFSTVMRADNVENGPPGNFDGPRSGGRKMIDGTYSLGLPKGRIAITPAVLANLWDFRDVILHPPWDVRPHVGPYFFSQLFENHNWRLDQETPFERNRIFQPSLNREVTEQVVVNVKAAFPAFANMRIVEAWAGALNATPDNMPTISAVQSVPGLFLGTGFSYGMTMGPAAGDALAALVQGKETPFDVSLYRYERYIDGSKLRFTH